MNEQIKLMISRAQQKLVYYAQIMMQKDARGSDSREEFNISWRLYALITVLNDQWWRLSHDQLKAIAGQINNLGCAAMPDWQELDPEYIEVQEAKIYPFAANEMFYEYDGYYTKERTIKSNMDLLFSLLDAIQLTPGNDGVDGDPGQSAYALAVQLGFAGTEAQWIESLKGRNGDRGDAGASAYDLAVALGYGGSLGQWLESLKGPKGDPGPTPRHVSNIFYYPANGHVYAQWSDGSQVDLGYSKGDKGDKGETGAPGVGGNDLQAYDLANRMVQKPGFRYLRMGTGYKPDIAVGNTWGGVSDLQVYNASSRTRLYEIKGLCSFSGDTNGQIDNVEMRLVLNEIPYMSEARQVRPWKPAGYSGAETLVLLTYVELPAQGSIIIRLQARTDNGCLRTEGTIIAKAI